jgi:mono/diheme cytochrome c family protein
MLKRIAGTLLAAAALAGCGGASKTATPAPTPAPGGEPAPEPPSAGGGSVEAQVAEGGKLYGQFCASCHGDQGQGDSAPAVVGKDALPLDPRPDSMRKVQFRTAGDIAGWVVANMPPKGDKPTPEQYYAILAFDLKANGVELKEPVGPDNAASIVLHP